MTALALPRRLAAFARRLRRDSSGLALIEFAYSMPLVFGIGMYGVEVANLALTNMRVSQIALGLADNASRVGEATALSQKRLREADINDVFEGARIQASRFDILENGRITLSSLEVNEDGGQWIHWQRCVGMKDYDSTYGDAGDGEDGTNFAGMGPAGARVQAPPGSAVMFVEINYDYEPVVASWLLGPRKLHYTAAFIVRDKRDLTQVYNPAPAANASECDEYTV